MTTVDFPAEVNIEWIKRNPATGEIERNRKTFKGANLEQARASAMVAMGNPRMDPQASGFVVSRGDRVEFWVKGLELLHE